MTTLTFNDVNLNPVPQNDGQIWLTSSELAKALGYAETDNVSKIYNRHKDEFTNAMTLTVKMGVNGINGSIRQKAVRIFSLRRCHLLAMFAKTAVAKLFRVWVLNILDKEVGNPLITVTSDEIITEKQAYQLKTAVEKRCQNNKVHYQTVWTAIKHRFEVSSYKNILAKDFSNALNLIKTIELPAPEQPNIAQNEFTQKMLELGIFKGYENLELIDRLQKVVSDLDFFLGEVRKNTATQIGAFKSIDKQLPNMLA